MPVPVHDSACSCICKVALVADQHSQEVAGVALPCLYHDSKACTQELEACLYFYFPFSPTTLQWLSVLWCSALMKKLPT